MSNWNFETLAECASVRDDISKYLAEDFVPDPSKRYRWYFPGASEENPQCVEYDVLSETRCFETVGFKPERFISATEVPKRVYKSGFKKFAHRCPVAALYSLLRRQAIILQKRRNEALRAEARVDRVRHELAKRKKDLKFYGFVTDIPEYKTVEGIVGKVV